MTQQRSDGKEKRHSFQDNLLALALVIIGFAVLLLLEWLGVDRKWSSVACASVMPFGLVIYLYPQF